MRRSVYCTASFSVCLELKPNSYNYRTQLPSIPKLQHYRSGCRRSKKPRRRPPILGTVRDYLADQTVLSHTLRACIGCGKFGKLAARIFPLTRQPFHHS